VGVERRGGFFSALMGVVIAEIHIEKYSVTALLLKVRTSRYMLG